MWPDHLEHMLMPGVSRYRLWRCEHVHTDAWRESRQSESDSCGVLMFLPAVQVIKWTAGADQWSRISSGWSSHQTKQGHTAVLWQWQRDCHNDVSPSTSEDVDLIIRLTLLEVCIDLKQQRVNLASYWTDLVSFDWTMVPVVVDAVATQPGVKQHWNLGAIRLKYEAGWDRQGSRHYLMAHRHYCSRLYFDQLIWAEINAKAALLGNGGNPEWKVRGRNKKQTQNWSSMSHLNEFSHNKVRKMKSKSIWTKIWMLSM